MTDSPASVTPDVMGNYELREQDKWLPIANVCRIMKNGLPSTAKISKDAKECMQECVSEFVSFITSEAIEKCNAERRKTVNGEDVLYALTSLGFENYGEVLKIYLAKYRNQINARQEEMADRRRMMRKLQQRKRMEAEGLLNKSGTGTTNDEDDDSEDAPDYDTTDYAQDASYSSNPDQTYPRHQEQQPYLAEFGTPSFATDPAQAYPSAPVARARYYNPTTGSGTPAIFEGEEFSEQYTQY